MSTKSFGRGIKFAVINWERKLVKETHQKNPRIFEDYVQNFPVFPQNFPNFFFMI